MKKQSPILFRSIAIIGLGLIGGSIALKIKEISPISSVFGVDLSIKNRREALSRGAVDAVFSKLGDWLKQVDLIVLAVPVNQVLLMIDRLKLFVSENTIITDVGSTKSEIVSFASQKKLRMIGGHPIAGTEKSGMKAAFPSLFEGKKWILTPSKISSKKDILNLSRWVRTLGAKAFILSPEEHDQVFAAVSHLPNTISYILASFFLKKPFNSYLEWSGSSLRDMTRLAESPPEMWRDIILSNRHFIFKALADFENELQTVKKSIHEGDADQLLKFFKQGTEMRKKI